MASTIGRGAAFTGRYIRVALREFWESKDTCRDQVEQKAKGRLTMKSRTQIMILVVGVLGYSMAVCLGQAPSDPSTTVRVLRAENKLLRAQVQALREQVAALTNQNARLKATPEKERIAALEAQLGKLKA